MATLTEATSPHTASPTSPGASLAVEYWTVSMDGQSSCGSCDDTLTTLTEAVHTIRPLAERVGITLDLQPRSVATWQQAIDQRITASPTLRAAGIELHPQHPDDSETRHWTWRGMTTTSPGPEAMVDFLLQAVAAHSQQLAEYFTSGGPAAYLRQYLHTARDAQPSPTQKG